MVAVKPLMLGAAMALIAGCTPAAPAMKSVAVTQIVELPSLNAVRDGIQEELLKSGFEADKTLKWTWETAQGNPSTASQIAKKFAGDSPDVIVAISTPSAQAVLAAAPRIPVVFSAVTDPIGAKLVSNLAAPGGLVTGVSDLSPVQKHLDLIAKITPKAKRIGVIYNAGEANSVTLVNLLKEAAGKSQITIVEASVANTSGVASAAKSLVGRVDAIYVPTDSTVISALESVLQVGTQNQLPVYAGDNESVQRGAIATLSFNYREVGRQTGQVVARILKGEQPGAIAVTTPAKLELTLNAKAAAAMGVKLPESLLSQAAKVFK
jgi:putative tryptophan/tyrosine transport system substrate-binding protein